MIAAGLKPSGVGKRHKYRHRRAHALPLQEMIRISKHVLSRIVSFPPLDALGIKADVRSQVCFFASTGCDAVQIPASRAFPLIEKEFGINQMGAVR